MDRDQRGHPRGLHPLAVLVSFNPNDTITRLRRSLSTYDGEEKRSPIPETIRWAIGVGLPIAAALVTMWATVQVIQTDLVNLQRQHDKDIQNIQQSDYAQWRVIEKLRDE